MASQRFIPTAEWGDRRQLRGLAGERAALGYLTSCGGNVEAHRFRMGRHDLDLVVRRDDLVAFAEVKTRRSSVCGSAVESVSRLKQHLVGKVALIWRLHHRRATDRYRFRSHRDSRPGRRAVPTGARAGCVAVGVEPGVKGLWERQGRANRQK